MMTTAAAMVTTLYLPWAGVTIDRDCFLEACEVPLVSKNSVCAAQEQAWDALIEMVTQPDDFAPVDDSAPAPTPLERALRELNDYQLTPLE